MLFFSKLLTQLVRTSTGLITLAAVFLIIAASVLGYFLEPDTFGNMFNSFWWVMTTVTTVGYGDFYPHTVAGKCLGIFLYIFGISFISIIISKIVDGLFGYKRRKDEGKLSYTGSNHFVMLDWSKNAELAIQEILNTDSTAEVVIIDTMDRTPYQHDRVHYVKGNPVHKETLEQANLGKAKAAFIFANEMTENHGYIHDSSFIDGKTLLIATTIERYFNNVYTIAEIKDKGNVHNFTHVKVDEFILSSETISQLAVRSAFNPGASKLLTQLLTRQHGDDLYEIATKPNWVNFRDAFEELLEQGATLISDGTHLNINRRLHEPIPESARLFVICNKDTYQDLLRKHS
jgi:voltage-gated potassium channel